MRLINADALKEKINTTFWSEIGAIIENASTIDAVEVVRCKECKHYFVEGETTRFGWCGYWNKTTDEMRYCSDGERS